MKFGNYLKHLDRKGALKEAKFKTFAKHIGMYRSYLILVNLLPPSGGHVWYDPNCKLQVNFILQA